MALYRLDPDEVMDPLWRRLNGERGAIRVAKARAKRLNRQVVVTRIDTHGHLSTARLVWPDGKVTRP